MVIDSETICLHFCKWAGKLLSVTQTEDKGLLDSTIGFTDIFTYLWAWVTSEFEVRFRAGGIG